MMQYKSLEKEESGNAEMNRTGLSREDVFQLAKKWYGTEPEYPWNDRNAVLRHQDNKKW